MMQKNDLHDIMQTNLDKMEQVLHYIIHEAGHLPHVGNTVLFKLLYFCDFDYYEMYEEPLTGEQYKKLDYGPAPILERAKKVLSGFRIVYAYEKKENKIIFVEIYHKSRKGTEDRDRISKYFRRALL